MSVDAGSVAPDGGLEGQDDGGAVGPPTVTVDGGLPAAARALEEADGILADVKHTRYEHDTFIDEATGTFNVDCSGLVNFVLEQAVPAAFTTLVQASRPRPLAEDYVRLVTSPPPAGTAPWQRVTAASGLVPGDIVSWLEPTVLHSTDTGHVMVVAAPPVVRSGEVEVLVIDAVSSGHGSTDLRTIHHTTGVGEGTIVLVVDASGAPTGYRWSSDPGDTGYTTLVGLGHLE